jgi:rhodanese-related sulfurtransferase
MIRTVDPKEAQALVERGGLDVVDVRGPAEWAAGHIPGARSVPLERLAADPRAALPRDGVLFVCAKGIRSLKAAQAAEAAGLTDLYHVDGGTLAWASAGLRVVTEGGGP